MKLLKALYCGVIIIGASSTFAADVSTGNAVVLRNNGPFAGQKIINDSILFSGDNGLYQIDYFRAEKGLFVNGKWYYGDESTGLGLRIPAIAGWYPYNALDVTVDGKPITCLSKADFITVAIDYGALAIFRWSNEYADLEFRFAFSDRQKALFCETKVTPKQKFGKLELKLRCYPGQVSPVRQWGSERRICSDNNQNIVAETSIINGELARCSPRSTEFAGTNCTWIFYSDAVFDFNSNILAGGPCALVAKEASRSGVKIQTDGYLIETFLKIPEEGGIFKFALVEFPQTDNKDAKDWLVQHSPRVVEELECVDFNIFPHIKKQFMKKLEKIYEIMGSCQDNDASKIKNMAEMLRLRTNINQEDISAWNNSIRDVDDLYEKALAVACRLLVKNSDK